MSYKMFVPVVEGGAARFTYIKNFDDDFELVEGVTLVDEFPDDAEYRMNADFPDDIQLRDFLHNLDDQMVVSQRVQEFLADRIESVEFLPVNIVNHKGRKVNEKYFIVNLLDLEDCVDQSATQFNWHKMDPELMENVKNLTLDESAISKNRQLFRLKGVTSVVAISEELLEELTNAGFTGLGTSDFREYKGS